MQSQNQIRNADTSTSSVEPACRQTGYRTMNSATPNYSLSLNSGQAQRRWSGN